MYRLFVSLRYLKAKKVNLFSIAGIAIGVMALIVVLSVMRGFDRELRLRIRGTLSDLIVQCGDVYGLTDYKEAMKKIESIPHVVACAPHLEGLALIRLGPYYKWAFFRGIDPKREMRVGDFKKYLIDNTSPDFLLNGKKTKDWPIIAGVELLKIVDDENGKAISLDKGDTVVMVTPASFSDYVVKRFVIVGKFRTGMYEYDSRYVYMDLKTAQRFRRAPNAVTSISVKLDDYAYAQQVREEIEKRLGPAYSVSTWEEQRRTFLRAVALERHVMAVILFAQIIIAGFMILGFLTMIVADKTRDIGTLRAIGATVDGILSIFVLDGFLIGLLGSLIGMGLGLLLALNLNPVADFVYWLTKFRVFPRDIYYLDRIPVFIDPVSVVFIFVAAIATSVLASIYPAVRAARLDPVEALRYE